MHIPPYGTPSSDCPSNLAVKFFPMFGNLYIARLGTNVASVTSREPKFTKMGEDLPNSAVVELSKKREKFHAAIFFSAAERSITVQTKKTSLNK